MRGANRGFLLVAGAAAIMLLAGTAFTKETGDGLVLHLRVPNAETIVFAPLVAEVDLTNGSLKAITGIPMFLPRTDGYDGGIRFSVTQENRKRSIGKTILILTHRDSELGPIDFELPAGACAMASVCLTMDWDDNTPIFNRPGDYQLCAELTIPEVGTKKSNTVTIRVREPESQQDKVAVRLLEEKGVLWAFYSGDLSLVDGEPTVIAQALKKLYNLGPKTSYYPWVRQRLYQWQALEARSIKIVAEGGLAPKQNGWDRLGLQDLKFEPTAGDLFKCSESYPATRQTSVSVEKDYSDAIGDLFGTLAANWNEGAIEKCMTLFTSDAKTDDGDSEAIRKRYLADFATRKKNTERSNLKMTVVDITPEKDEVDVLVVREVAVGSRILRDGAPMLTCRVRKTTSGWKIVSIKSGASGEWATKYVSPAK